MRDAVATGKRHFALFGNPVRQSLSPLMMNAAFGAMGLRAGYESHRVENLELAVRMIRERPLDGVSVTLPLKGPSWPFSTRWTTMPAPSGPSTP